MRGKTEALRLESAPQAEGRRWILSGLVAVLLSGCVSTAPKVDPAPAQSPPLLRQAAARLPGEYVSVRKADERGQRLSIERAESAPHGLGLQMIQTDRDGSNARRYGLSLEATDMAHRFKGSFAVLDGRNQARRSCPMRFHATRQGLVGETDPASCRFGEGDKAVGLLKEIAFGDRRITIADRLMDAESGAALGEDQVIRFLPAVEFSGWLGVRDGGDWRVARDFSLGVGERLEPRDAAEMSMGLAIALDYYRMERDTHVILLRLTLIDIESDEVVAESWAEPGSGSIGLALEELQVGLQRTE